jgi:DNA (cytosine-5)-methyltransferase 1
MNPTNRNSPPPTFIEFCAGGGGLSSGLIKAGWEAKALVEIDPIAVQTLKANHPTVEVLEADMRSISLEHHWPVDMLCAGMPCQSFSTAGKRRGLSNPRGQLFPVFVGQLRQISPRQFMIENVKGLVSHDKGNTLRLLVSLLSVDGRYDVKCAVLDASRYGVPQKRERLLIIGRLKGMEPFHFPLPLDGARPTLREALANCPISACASYSAAKKKILELVPAGGCWTSLPVALQREYLGRGQTARLG